MPRPLYRNYAALLLMAEPRVGLGRLSQRRSRRLAALVAVVFVFAAGLLWQRMQVVKIGYDVLKLSRERDRLASENSVLRRDLRRLYTLAHAENVARRDLGMENLDPTRVVYLPDPAPGGPGMIRRAWRSLSSLWGG